MRPALAITLWACLHLLSRLLYLTTDATEIYSQDELYNGAAALEIAAGRGLPLPLMAHAPYCGGPILLALIAPTLFDIFGSNVFALRLPSMLASTLTCALWLTIVRRSFGSYAMQLTGVLFVLSPPFYSLLTIIGWANHAESNLFTAITLVCLVALHGRDDQLLASDERDGRRNIALGALMGASATVALFFSLAALVVSVAAAVALVLLGRRALWRRSTVAAIVGAAVGALPALLLSQAWRAHGILGLMSIARPGIGDPVHRLLSLTVFDSRFYLRPHAGLPRVIEALFWVGAMASIAYLTLRAGRRLVRDRTVGAELLLVVPPLAFAVVYAVSSFPMGPRAMGFMGYRYLVIVTPSVLAAMAVAVTRLPRRPGLLVVAVLVAPNVIAIAQRLPHASTYALRAQPSSYFAYAIKLFETLDYDLDRTLPLLDPIEDPVHRKTALEGLGLRHATDYLSQHPGPTVVALTSYLRDALPRTPEHRAIFARRLAFLYTLPGRLELTRRDYDSIAATIDQVDVDGELGPVAATAVLALGDSIDLDLAQLMSAVDALPPRLQVDGWRGLGIVAARRQCQGREHDLAAPDGQRRVVFDEGIGFEVARMRALRRGVESDSCPALRNGDMRRGRDQLLHVFEPQDEARRQLIASQLELTRGSQ